MTFGEDWGWGASKEQGQRMFDLFAEAGGTFINLLYLHVWDFTTPVEEVLRGLDDLVSAGQANPPAGANPPSRKKRPPQP